MRRSLYSKVYFIYLNDQSNYNGYSKNSVPTMNESSIAAVATCASGNDGASLRRTLMIPT